MTIILTIIASILGASTLGLGYVYMQERERTKKLDSLKNIKNDILTFGDQKSQMENLISSLRTETLKVQTLVSDLQNSKSQLEDQLNLLKSELSKTETSLKKLSSQNSEEQQKVLQLQRQTENTESELNKLSKEVIKFTTEKEIAEKQFKISKADLTELQFAVSKVKQQKDDFQTEISTLSRLIAEKKTLQSLTQVTL